MKKHLIKLTLVSSLLLGISLHTTTAQNLTLYTEQETKPSIPIATIRSLTFEQQQLNLHFHDQREAMHIPFETLQKMTFNVYDNILSTESKEGLQTFPNPVKETLHIHLPQTEQNANNILQILTIDGKSIYLHKHTTSNIQIDVKNWDKGVYILNIQSANKTETRKIIKK